MKVRCDACKKQFNIKPKTTIIDQDREGQDVTWEYFVCPKCKKKYTFAVKDEEQRRMISNRAPLEQIKEREKMLRIVYEVE